MSEKHQTDNKFIPMLALEKMNKKKDEPVINIVNGGSFGRLNTTNQNMTESTDFQYSLKKAIVSLQRLKQATSTTGETPYNNITSIDKSKAIFRSA